MALGLAIYNHAERQDWPAEQRHKLTFRRQTETSEFDVDVYRYSGLDDATVSESLGDTLDRTPSFVRHDTSSEGSQPATPERGAHSPFPVNTVTASCESRPEAILELDRRNLRWRAKGTPLILSGTPRGFSASPGSPSSPSGKARLSIGSLSKSFRRSFSFGRQSSVSSIPATPTPVPPVPSLTPGLTPSSAPLQGPLAATKGSSSLTAEEAAHAVIAARGRSLKMAAGSASDTANVAPLPPSGSSQSSPTRSKSRTSRVEAWSDEVENLSPPTFIEAPFQVPQMSIVLPPPQTAGPMATAFINPWESTRSPASSDRAQPTSPTCRSTSLPPSVGIRSPAPSTHRSPPVSPTPSKSPRGCGGRASRDGEISPTTIVPPPMTSQNVVVAEITPNPWPNRSNSLSGHRRFSSQGSTWSPMARTRRESSFASRGSKRGLWHELVWAGPATGRPSIDQFPSTPSDDGEAFLTSRRPSEYFGQGDMPPFRQRRASSLPSADLLGPKYTNFQSMRSAAEWRINLDGGANILVNCE